MSASAATRRPWILLIPLLLFGGIAAAYLFWRAQPPRTVALRLAEHSALGLDLSRPDGLIESTSLAQLPRDLLQVPLLRDTLTEDFVFYYERHPDRLGLSGALRRIAYEHELQWSDRLLQELLDQPAEIALWRGPDGKLAHALLRLRRGALAALLEPLARVAANDTQLSCVGLLELDGEALPLYRLRYNFDRELLLLAQDEHLLLLSSADLLLTGTGNQLRLGSAQVAQLEAVAGGEHPWSARFKLAPNAQGHRLSLSADYLALGYGQFIPQLAGVRFEMDPNGWRSFVALGAAADAAALDFNSLWQAMPIGAGACAAVPLSSTALQPLFDRLVANQGLNADLLQRLQGPGALCWYGKSRLHAPLLVTRLAGAADARLDESLGQAFEAMIGAWEAKAELGRHPVDRSATAATVRWNRQVGSSFGLHSVEADQAADQFDYSHYFRVSLARHGDWLLFSLDDALVDQGLATLQKRFPPLAEQLPKGGPVAIYLAPESLATLLEQETLSSLPSDMEAVFRNAAEAHLLPKLRAFGQHRPYALALPEGSAAQADWTWLPVDWKAL